MHGGGNDGSATGARPMPSKGEAPSRRDVSLGAKAAGDGPTGRVPRPPLQARVCLQVLRDSETYLLATTHSATRRPTDSITESHPTIRREPSDDNQLTQ